MNATTQAAPVEQHQSTRLNINFTHRLGWDIQDKGLSAQGLNDCVTDMADRADAILILLQSQFIGADDGRIGDGVIFNALEAVMKEVNDMRSIVSSFQAKEHAKKHHV